MKKLITALSLIIIVFTAFSQNGNSALTVDGRLLKDSCGETIILRGVNHGNIWASDMGIPEFAQIAQTGANCVRICLERQYVTYPDGNPVSQDLRGGQIDTIIQAALDQKLIPIVELHDFTDGSTQHAHVQTNLDSAVIFWTKPLILTALKKHSRFLILNLANEPEHWLDTDQQFYDACSTAVAGIRAAGLKVPILIDGMHWGQDETFFMNNSNGASLVTGDPEHKLLFSVHAYWQTSDVPDAVMSTRFASMFNSGLPYIIGEFAYDGTNTCTNTISYHLIMDLCQQYQIGYLYWWWGFYNPTSNNCLSMTQTGTYAGLANQGLEVAVTYINSIKNTSARPHLLTDGRCSTSIDDTHKDLDISVFPNPCEGTFYINSSEELAKVKLFDIVGNDIPLNKTGISSFSVISPYSGIYLIIVSLADGHQVIKKLIIQ